MLRIAYMTTSYEIALRWMPQNIFVNKSTLAQLMVCCLTASAHSVPCGVARPRWVDEQSVWKTNSLVRHIIWSLIHDDVINWKHFPRYWPFVRGIHRSPVNSPHKGQWRGALMLFLFALNKRLSKQSRGWWLRRHRAHYDIIVMM